MNVTIINNGSGLKKACVFVDLGSRGAWAEVRYPGAAGLFSFSLVHGGIECKRNEHPLWRLADADLIALRELAKCKGVKCSQPKKQKPHRPTRPKTPTVQRQLEMFK
jgi:hypothetical protein